MTTATHMESARPGEAGDALPEIAKQVSQAQVNAYAEAASDFNPIHLDEEYSKKSQFGGRIAHGMLILAFVSEMMDQAFPEGWSNGGRLKVRFKAPVYPGETVTTHGEVVAVRGSSRGPVAECRVGCRKKDGTEAVAGQAFVALGMRGESD